MNYYFQVSFSLQVVLYMAKVTQGTVNELLKLCLLLVETKRVSFSDRWSRVMKLWEWDWTRIESMQGVSPQSHSKFFHSLQFCSKFLRVRIVFHRWNPDWAVWIGGQVGYYYYIVFFSQCLSSTRCMVGRELTLTDFVYTREGSWSYFSILL